MTDTFNGKINEVERYIREGAAVRVIDKLLKEIKEEVNSSTLQDSQNYKKLL